MGYTFAPSDIKYSVQPSASEFRLTTGISPCCIFSSYYFQAHFFRRNKYQNESKLILFGLTNSVHFHTFISVEEHFALGDGLKLPSFARSFEIIRQQFKIRVLNDYIYFFLLFCLLDPSVNYTLLFLMTKIEQFENYAKPNHNQPVKHEH